MAGLTRYQSVKNVRIALDGVEWAELGDVKFEENVTVEPMFSYGSQLMEGIKQGTAAVTGTFQFRKVNSAVVKLFNIDDALATCTPMTITGYFTDDCGSGTEYQLTIDDVIPTRRTINLTIRDGVNEIPIDFIARQIRSS